MIRVLVVDDDEAARVGVTTALKSEGLDAVMASTAEDCLNQLEAASAESTSAGFDAIVLDLRMPGRDGDEIISAIRRSYPFTAIIILTAYATIDTAVNTMWNGAYLYLNKPCDPRRDLLPVIRTGVARHRVRRMQQELFTTDTPVLRFEEIEKTLKDLAPIDSRFFLLRPDSDSKRNLRVVHSCDMPGDGYDVPEYVDPESPLVTAVYANQQLVREGTESTVADYRPLTGDARSLLAAPIPGFHGHAMGMLVLESSSELAFSAYTQNVIEELANLVGLSLGLKAKVDVASVQETFKELELAARSSAHYIRNPLHVLRSTLSLAGQMDLRSDTDTLDRWQRLLSQCEASCQEIEGVVDRLFHISTPIESEEMAVVDLGELLKGRAANYQAIAECSEVGFSFVSDGSTTSVRADQNDLLRAFDVVVDNAIEACAGRDAADVRMHIRRNFDDIVIRVSDNGPGIDSQFRNKLFDPLFSTKGSSESHGAGLYTARKILQRHEGQIVLDANTSEGASFAITLPAVDFAMRSLNVVPNVEVGYTA